MPGYYNEDGLYVYAEDDLITPNGRFSDLLNKGLASVPGAVSHEEAVKAVDIAMTEANLVKSSDRRLPAAGSDKTVRFADDQGQVSLSANEDGTVNLGSTVVKEGRGVRFMDEQGYIAAEVKEDGKFYVYDPADAITGTTYLIPAGGQSNGAGRGQPHGGQLDQPNPRVWQYGAKAHALSIATVPLDSPDSNPNAGLSVFTVAALDFLATLGPNDRVVIVSGAYGGTGVINASGAGVWATDYSGAKIKLYSQWIGLINEAKAAIASKWGVAPVIPFALWHQGEQDAGNGVTQAAYVAGLDPIVTSLRADLGIASLPFVLGGMVPEWVATAGAGTAIQRAHEDTPRRLPLTAYAPGVRDARNPASDSSGVHYNRRGAAAVGHGMFAAIERARANYEGTEPVAPFGLVATLRSGTLTATWQPPLTRVTSYLVEVSYDGGAWTALDTSAHPIGTSATVTGVTATKAEVRVSTVNSAGTSYPSTTTQAGA